MLYYREKIIIITSNGGLVAACVHIFGSYKHKTSFSINVCECVCVASLPKLTLWFVSSKTHKIGVQILQVLYNVLQVLKVPYAAVPTYTYIPNILTSSRSSFRYRQAYHTALYYTLQPTLHNQLYVDGSSCIYVYFSSTRVYTLPIVKFANSTLCLYME